MAIGFVGAGLAGGAAHAEALSNSTFLTHVNVEVLPVAELQILGSNLLYLEIPPAGSTIPAAGVNFIVTGNAHATLTAEPDAFMQVGSQYLGKATLGSESVGYKVELRFPARASSVHPFSTPPCRARSRSDAAVAHREPASDRNAAGRRNPHGIRPELDTERRHSAAGPLRRSCHADVDGRLLSRSRHYRGHSSRICACARRFAASTLGVKADPR